MQVSKGNSSRLIQLDVLRALAIVLVLLTHLGPTIKSWSADLGQGNLLYLVAHAGWIGVPVFFVLSGFLIGHLLQGEELTTGKIDLLRFLFRRGLKIYPAFYLLLVVYTVYLWKFEGTLCWERVLREIFFLQNYGIGGILEVSWSLAVEEHFYLCFGGLSALTAWYFTKAKTNRLQHWRWLPWTASVLLVLCLIARIAVEPGDKPTTAVFPTHLRIDALFMGAALAWFQNAHPKMFCRLFSGRCVLAALIFVIVAIPAAVPEAVFGRHFLHTWYLVYLTLASMFLLGAALLAQHPMSSWGWKCAAYIGRHSYCIYLYHLPWYRLSTKLWERLGWQPTWWAATLWCVLGAILLGVIVTRLIEIPMLRLRDRVMPAPRGQGVPLAAEPVR